MCGWGAQMRHANKSERLTLHCDRLFAGGPTGVKLGTGSWSSLCPENLRKSKFSDLGVDHEVATGDLGSDIGRAGNADYGGDLLRQPRPRQPDKGICALKP